MIATQLYACNISKLLTVSLGIVGYSTNSVGKAEARICRKNRIPLIHARCWQNSTFNFSVMNFKHMIVVEVLILLLTSEELKFLLTRLTIIS